MAQHTRKRKQQRPKRSKQRSNNTAFLEFQDQPVNILEMSRRMKQKKFPVTGPMRKGLDMTWDDVSLGAGSVQTRDGLLDERDRKDTYYKVYIANQWVSGCVDVIAKRITSGGWKCVETEDGKGNPKNEQRIKDLLNLENLEEDFVQLLNSIATDLEIFGESFCELVYDPSGNLVNLCMIDCVSMTTFFDKHGNVTGYKQTLEKSLESVWFEPHEIVRWWLPDPRAKKKALSPIEKLKDPVYLQQAMDTWQQKFFKQGGKPAYSVEMGPDANEDDADRYLLWWRENYLGIQNAHVPPITYGGGKIVEFGKGSIDIDFDKGEDKQRLKIIVVYGVPPAQLSIIESGNLGGGTGEDQNKAFVNNTITPLANIILEKFNYRVLKKAMNITDWKITTQYADYRNDTTVADIEDKQIRNGTLNVDEARAEHGRTPVAGGSENVIVTSKDVTPVARFGDLADEQKQSAQLDLDTKQAQIDKIKNPPAPPQPILMHPGLDQKQDDGQTPEDKFPLQGGKGQQDKEGDAKETYSRAIPKVNQAYVDVLLQSNLEREQFQWRYERLYEQSHTGVMVAFFLKPSEAQQLVLPGGESVDQLHCTLVYLGDKSDVGDLDKLRQTIAKYAQSASPLQGAVSGIGRFLAVPDGDLTPVYASVDAPRLPEWRQGLVQALIDAGFPLNTQHGFSPHITLAYVDKSVPMPIETIATIPLKFDTLWLSIGDDRYAFPLDKTEEKVMGDEEERWLIEYMMKYYREKDRAQFIASQQQSSRQDTRENEGKTARTQETSYSSETQRASEASQEVVHWQEGDPTIQKQLVALKEKGVKTLGPWTCHPGACDSCKQNQGQTVELGKTFKSGCYMSPNHNHCACTHKENM